MKILYTILIFFFFFSFQLTLAKICWLECSDGLIDQVDIIGCHRRSGKNGKNPRFRCKGTEGPPCIVKRGDTVNLEIKFNPKVVLKNVTQSAVWETAYINIPWVGLEKNACKFMVNNEGCVKNELQNSQFFSYPIAISKMYPTRKFPLRWAFEMKNTETGEITKIGCFKYNIRIV